MSNWYLTNVTVQIILMRTIVSKCLNQKVKGFRFHAKYKYFTPILCCEDCKGEMCEPYDMEKPVLVYIQEIRVRHVFNEHVQDTGSRCGTFTCCW